MRYRDFAALAKQLQPDLPGYVFHAPIFLATPVSHILRALCFEGSSFSKTVFYVTAFALPLYVPTDCVCLQYGTRLRVENGADMWDMGDSNVLAQLRKAIARQAKPVLDSTQTPASFMNWLLSNIHRDYLHGQQALGYTAALLGDAERAVEALRRLTTLADRSVAWQSRLARESQALVDVLLQSQSDAMGLLERWEAESVRCLRLDDFR